MDNLDSSFSESTKKYGFKEKHGRTYYGPVGTRFDREDYVFSFTLEVIAHVKGKTKHVAGLLCFLRQKDNPELNCEVFIRHASWQNLDAFIKDLQNGYNMPPTVVKAKKSVLQIYMAEKYSGYVQHCRNSGFPRDKDRITHLGLQDDNLTWCFGRNAIFQSTDNGAKRLSAIESLYVWVPSKDNDLREDLGIYPRTKTCILFTLLRGHLSEEDFNGWLAMAGHSWLSLMYSLIIPRTGHIPVMCVTGPTNVGKTLLSELGLFLYGQGTVGLCSIKGVTEAAFYQRPTKIRFPFVGHDIDDAALIPAITEAVHERKPFVNCVYGAQGVHPTSSAMFTMNPDAFQKLMDKSELRVRSRIVPIVLRNQAAEPDEEVKYEWEKAKRRASQYLPALIHVDNMFLTEFSSKVRTATDAFKEILMECGIQESVGRIAKSYAMVQEAVYTVLNRTGDTESNRDSFTEYLRHLIKSNAPFYHVGVNASASQSISASFDPALLCSELVAALTEVLDAFGQEQMKSILRLDYARKQQLFVALRHVRPSEIQDSSAGKTLMDAAAVMEKIPSVLRNQNVKFGRAQHKAILMPVALFDKSEVEMLQYRLSAHVLPSDSEMPFEELGSALPVNFQPLACSSPQKPNQPAELRVEELQVDPSPERAIGVNPRTMRQNVPQHLGANGTNAAKETEPNPCPGDAVESGDAHGRESHPPEADEPDVEAESPPTVSAEAGGGATGGRLDEDDVEQQVATQNHETVKAPEATRGKGPSSIPSLGSANVADDGQRIHDNPQDGGLETEHPVPGSTAKSVRSTVGRNKRMHQKADQPALHAATDPSVSLGLAAASFSLEISSRDDLEGTLLSLAKRQRRNPGNTSLIAENACAQCRSPLRDEEEGSNWLRRVSCTQSYHRHCGKVAEQKALTRAMKDKLKHWACTFCISTK